MRLARRLTDVEFEKNSALESTVRDEMYCILLAGRRSAASIIRRPEINGIDRWLVRVQRAVLQAVRRAVRCIIVVPENQRQLIWLLAGRLLKSVH